VRQAILFNERGPVVYKNVRMDTTGEPLILIDKSEVSRLLLDFTAYLGAGETISSATIAADAVTAAIVVASPLITLTFSGATSWSTGSGNAVVLVTFSSGDVESINLRVRQTNRYDDETLLPDYV
jgi:hypothetical protein